MTWRQTDIVGSLREAEDGDPLTFEGIAVPYGALSVTPVKEYGRREAFAPGAFRSSVEHWMTRKDGARMPFRPSHGEKPIGAVQTLAETPDGVTFRVKLLDTPQGREYAEGVRAGLNGVSVHFDAMGDPVVKDGFVLHRAAKLFDIAGSVNPAYDGARLSVRDMEDEPIMDTTTPATTPATTAAPEAATRQDAQEPPVGRTADQVGAERSQVQAIGGGAADRRTDVAMALLRGEAVYGSNAVDEHGNHRSFIRDLVNAGRDSGAMERQQTYSRQLTDVARALERAGDVLSSEIPGAYPNVYLPGVFTPRILKSRPMANFIDSYPITDALPKIFAKVSTSTSATVQASQTTNPAASDFATTAVTATPLLYGASSLVARQVVDGASPAAEQMLLQDMQEAYGQVTEAATVTAVEAGATASGTAITAATPWAGTLGNVIKYQTTRFRPAEGQFYPSALYAVLLAQGDTTGRPFMPQLGLMNSDGSVDAGAGGGRILSATTILSWGSTANVVVTLRRDDYVIFESPVLNFRYEQATGPAGFNIGVWAYFVCATRLGGLSVTAA